MNRSPRVLLIGRYFWPHGSIDSAGALMQMASALHRRGVHVEVLSPRFGSSWPDRIVVREIVVHRVAAFRRSDWLTGKYARGLTAWLQQHAASFDVILVDSIREEALAALEIAKYLSPKVILRCQGWGQESDIAWWDSGRIARRCGAAARSAELVIANSGTSERELVAEGFDPRRIEKILPGFAAAPARSEQRRRAARIDLAKANSDLNAEPDAPVVLCTARMIRKGAIDLLVGAAYALISRYPNLRLWFVGDGPHRDAIYQRLRADGVRASIAMPGSFCDSEDIFAAADIFFQGDDSGLEYFLPMAISSQLPVVAVDRVSIRDFLQPRGIQAVSVAQAQAGAGDRVDGSSQPGDLVEWCEKANSKGVRGAISNVLENLDDARRQAELLRRMLLRNRPYSDTADAYLMLIKRLIPQMSLDQSGAETEVAT